MEGRLEPWEGGVPLGNSGVSGSPLGRGGLWKGDVFLGPQGGGHGVELAPGGMVVPGWGA